MKTFEFWFDFGSPAAYLAFTQIKKLEELTGASAVHRPVLSGGVLGAPTFFVGNQVFWGQDRLDFVKEALQ